MRLKSIDDRFFGRSRIALGIRYFVVTRRRKACLLLPPQHGGARLPTLTPVGPTFLTLRDLRLWVQCSCGGMLKCGAVKACHSRWRSSPPPPMNGVSPHDLITGKSFD
jgi:hypothetical protein